MFGSSSSAFHTQLEVGCEHTSAASCTGCEVVHLAAGSLQGGEVGPAAEAEGRAVWAATEALTAGLAAELAEQLRCGASVIGCTNSFLSIAQVVSISYTARGQTTVTSTTSCTTLTA